MKFLQVALIRVVPICFVLGASMELFMIKTGFYEIVTRKEAERRADYLETEERRRNRMRDLKIKFEIDEESK